MKVPQLSAPAGARQVITFSSGAGLFTPKDIVSWESAANEPEELELLVYPRFYGEAGVTAAFITSTWNQVFLDLQLTLGSGGQERNSIQWSPLFSYADGTLFSNMSLPSNGLRLRFTASKARLQVWNIFSGTFNCALFASFTPCRGAPLQNMPQCHPLSAVALPQFEIPKGAREVRIKSTDPTGSLVIFQPGNPPTSKELIVAASASDWVPFTPHGYFFGYQLSSASADPNDINVWWR